MARARLFYNHTQYGAWANRMDSAKNFGYDIDQEDITEGGHRRQCAEGRIGLGLWVETASESEVKIHLGNFKDAESPYLVMNHTEVYRLINKIREALLFAVGNMAFAPDNNYLICGGDKKISTMALDDQLDKKCPAKGLSVNFCIDEDDIGEGVPSFCVSLVKASKENSNGGVIVMDNMKADEVIIFSCLLKRMIDPPKPENE